MAILSNYSDFEDRIRVQRELATIKAFKELTTLDRKPWRFGHSPNQIHAKTVISVEDGGIYELPTQRIYDYINQVNPAWIISKYGIYNSKAYQIEIHDLVAWCGQEMGFSV